MVSYSNGKVDESTSFNQTSPKHETIIQELGSYLYVPYVVFVQIMHCYKLVANVQSATRNVEMPPLYLCSCQHSLFEASYGRSGLPSPLQCYHDSPRCVSRLSQNTSSCSSFILTTNMPGFCGWYRQSYPPSFRALKTASPSLGPFGPECFPCYSQEYIWHLII